MDDVFARSYAPLLRADYAPSALVAALPQIARAQPALFVSGRYFVAELNGLVVGAGGWSAGAPGSGQVQAGLGHVRHVATDARHVRHGVGRAIVERAMADARAQGIRRLACVSTLSAAPFYRALGFAELGPRTLNFGGVSFPAIDMERDL